MLAKQTIGFYLHVSEYMRLTMYGIQAWVSAAFDDSQCIDMGTDFYGITFDIKGNPRWDISGVGDTGTLTDMGAYEYQP